MPSKGGPAWFELTSEHFTMWTDAELVQAREFVGKMERLRQVIAGVAFPAAPSGRILVIATRDDGELSLAWRNRDARAFAISATGPLYQPRIFLSVFSNHRDTDVTLTHELSHAISFAVFQRQPRWFAEGMAQYFATTNVDLHDNVVDVGVAPQVRGGRKQMAHLVPVSTLFGWNTNLPAESEARMYSTAWALFTFMINDHRAELLRYIELLNGAELPADPGGPPPVVRAWRTACPSVPLDSVDQELRSWLVTGSHKVLHYQLEPHPARFTERALSDAEVHAVQGLLIADENQEHEHLVASLALDPTNVLARLLELYHRKAMPSVADARATAAAHPDDWRAWWLEVLARRALHADDPAIATAAAQACSLIALNPAVRAPPQLCAAKDEQASSP